jgi:histidine triad (HIT) family protein
MSPRRRLFAAINDINPQAETHILVIPERHVDTFRDVDQLNGGESKRMLEFIAEVARDAGLTDYQVITNVGRSAGQTVFHLHWHVIGDTKSHLDAAYTLTTAVSEW